MTNYSRSVLLSNGFPHPKIRLKKFGFSPKTIPANIAKNYRHNAVPNRFSTSLTNGPRPLSQVKAGTHSALLKESHTAAHTAKHGAFRMGALLLPSERSARSPTSPGRVSERQTLPLWGLGQGYSRRTQKAFGTAMRLCVSLFRGIAAPLGCVICLQLGDVAVFSLCAQYFLNVRGGGGITTLGPFRTFTNIPGPGVRTAYFTALGSWPGGALEERRKPSGQRCAYARRCPAGVAAPLGCVIFIRMLIALLGGPVANFPALWYDKFNKLESVMH